MLGCKLQLLQRTVRDIKFIVPLNAFTTSQCTKASVILKIKHLYIVLNLALEGEVHYLMTLPVCKIIEAVIGHVHNICGKRRTKNSEKVFFQCHSIYYNHLKYGIRKQTTIRRKVWGKQHTYSILSHHYLRCIPTYYYDFKRFSYDKSRSLSIAFDYILIGM